MYNEIAKLVFDYTKKNKMADEEFTKKVIGYVIEERNLNDYISKIDIGYDEVEQCHYNNLNNELGISLKEISGFNRFDIINNRVLLTNLNVVQTIFHELDHTLCNKEVTENTELLEKPFLESRKKLDVPKLFTMSDEEAEELSKKGQNDLQLEVYKSIFDLLLKTIKYNIYHDMDPIERRANINSHIDLDSIINILSDTSLRDLDKVQLIKIKKFIKDCKYGYKIKGNISNCPTCDYLLKINKKEDLSMYKGLSPDLMETYKNGKDNYSLQERIIYGLPLSSTELDSINIKSNPFGIYKRIK